MQYILTIDVTEAEASVGLFGVILERDLNLKTSPRIPPTITRVPSSGPPEVWEAKGDLRVKVNIPAAKRVMHTALESYTRVDRSFPGDTLDALEEMMEGEFYYPRTPVRLKLNTRQLGRDLLTYEGTLTMDVSVFSHAGKMERDLEVPIKVEYKLSPEESNRINRMARRADLITSIEHLLRLTSHLEKG